MRQQNPHFAQARARQALRQAGFDDPHSMVRASSTRNEVFITDDLVVRVNRQPNQRLRREALLCRFLPNAAWAPDVMAYGGEVGADFLVVRRRPGAPLSRWWPDLTPELRRRAVSHLAAALTELHQTPTPVQVPRVDQAPQLIDPRGITPVVPLLVAIDALRGAEPALMTHCQELVQSLGDCLNDYHQRTLIHGDLTFENILWDGAKLSAIVDFEWCRGAPLDLELDVLLRFCAFPHAHVADDYEHRTQAEDYLDVPVWLAEDRPDLFSRPDLADRLLLYSVSYCVQELTTTPHLMSMSRTTRGPLHPLTRLADLLDHRGHLDAILRRIGVTV